MDNKNYHQILIVTNSGTPDLNKDSVNLSGYVGNDFTRPFLFDCSVDGDTIRIKEQYNMNIGITRVMRFR